jgi:hypothetical protein
MSYLQGDEKYRPSFILVVYAIIAYSGHVFPNIDFFREKLKAFSSFPTLKWVIHPHCPPPPTHHPTYLRILVNTSSFMLALYIISPVPRDPSISLQVKISTCQWQVHPPSFPNLLEGI